MDQKTIIRMCKECNKIKNIDMFATYRNKSRSISRLHRCNECQKIIRKQQNKQYYENKKALKQII